MARKAQTAASDDANLVEQPGDDTGGAPPPDAAATAAAADAPPAPAEKMKMRAPDGVTSVSVHGVLIDVKDGFVEVEGWIARHLAEAFGFVDGRS